MSFALEDPVRMISQTSQTGSVYRCNPLGVIKGIIILWSAGPLYSEGEMVGYFGPNYDLLEGYTP